MADSRVKDLPLAESFANDDYIYLDGATNGSRKFKADDLSKTLSGGDNIEIDEDTGVINCTLPLTVVNGKLCVIYDDGED